MRPALTFDLFISTGTCQGDGRIRRITNESQSQCIIYKVCPASLKSVVFMVTSMFKSVFTFDICSVLGLIGV